MGEADTIRHCHFYFFVALVFTLLTLNLPFPAMGAPKSDAISVRFEKNADDARTALAKRLNEATYEQLNDLEDLRERLARDRELAGGLADSGTLETRILEAQIKELGPPPEEGKSEPSAITQRRDELDQKLTRQMEPVLRMREAHARAATLVSEIDDRINKLDGDKLFRRDRSPLDPALWLDAISDLGEGIRTIASELRKTFSEHETGRLLLSIGIAFAAAIAGPIGIAWLWRRASRLIYRRFEQSEYLATRLMLNLLKDVGYALTFGFVMAIIAIGLIALLSPFLSNKALIGSVFVTATGALFLAIAEWLGKAVLFSPFEELRLVKLTEGRAKEAMQTIRIFGTILAIEIVLEFIEIASNATVAITGLLSTLLVVAGGATFWRFGNLIAPARGLGESGEVAVDGQVAHEQNPLGLARLLSRALKIFAIAIVVTAAIGYMMLARYIFVSTVGTMAVIAIAIYLHRSFKMILEAIAAGPLYAYRRIFQFLPLATGLIFLLGALFFIALIWGYRLQEISDVLVLLRNGIEFGDIRISAGDVFTFAIVFIVGYAATRWVQQFLRISILPEFELDRGGQSAIVTGIGYFGILLAAVIAIASTGLDLSSLAFVAGALSVGLGFGLQSTIENFTSGVILLIERPIKEGDWIEVGAHSGIVRKIAVRSTQIETFDRHHIIIPNSQLITGSVKNLSFSGTMARISVPIGVSYGTNVDKVRSLLLDIGRSVPNVLANPEPIAVLDSFGDSSINFKLLCFIADVTTGAGTQSDLNLEIARRFAKEGIEIPFPQRDIHIRAEPTPDADGNEALHPGQHGLPSSDSAGSAPPV